MSDRDAREDGDAGTYRAKCHDCDASKTYNSEYAGAKAYSWVESHKLTGHNAYYYEAEDAE